MPCYKPTRVLMDRFQSLQWGRDYRYLNDGESVMNMPCRKCIGCTEGQKRDWSVRCFHEALTHSINWTDPDTKINTKIPNSSILTLTYNDEHLPHNGALYHPHFQQFMKRLRKRRVDRGDHTPIRYFMAGEYGGKTLRPHFHCILYGESFDDRYTVVEGNKTLTMSYELDSLWSIKPYAKTPRTNVGRATVESFSFAGAAYVAGYVAKKITNVSQGPTIDTVDSTGTRTIKPIKPEYRKMSTGGHIKNRGLGAEYALSHLKEIYAEDCVKISKWTFHPPRYYDILFKRKHPELWPDILANRLEGQSKASEEWSPERCASAELLALSNLQLRRDSL